MDKDILMIDALRKIIRALTLFSTGTTILPEIKVQLDPKRKELGSLALIFVNLLLEETNIITDPELSFAQELHEVIQYGIAQDQPLTLAATDQLNTYIREKTALVEAWVQSKGEAVHLLTPVDEPSVQPD